MKSTEAGPGLPPTVSHARALEVASDAGDLHAVEELMIDLMRRGTGREDDTTGDIAAMLVDAAIEACRIASAGTPDASRATATLIRRTVLWCASVGELEGAYSLAHLTGDVATLEDVYHAASRARPRGAKAERVLAAVRDRLAQEGAPPLPHPDET